MNKYNLLKIGLVLAMTSIAGIAFPQITVNRNDNGLAVTMAIRDVDLLVVLNTMFLSTNESYRVKYEESATPFLAGRVTRMDVKGMPFDTTLRKVFDDSTVPLDFTKAPIANGVMMYSIFAKPGATFNIPNPPAGLDPLNQPPRNNPNNNNGAAKPARNPLQPDPPVAFDLQPFNDDDDNDVPVIGPPTGGPVDLGPPVIDTGTDTPGTTTDDGDTVIDDPDTGFLPEPEKNNDPSPSTVTKPASSEYFVRIIPVAKMNLSSLALSLGVKTANVNDSRSGSSDWWAGGGSSSSSSLSSSSGSSTGTGSSYGTGGSSSSSRGSSYGTSANVEADIARLKTLYEAVEQDYQMLYTQAFSLNASKNPGLTSAMRSLRNKHDRLVSDLSDKWRLSDAKSITYMQERLMSLQSDIDEIRMMDDSLKNPMSQMMNQNQNQTPQYDSNGNLIETKTSTDINSQLKAVQTGYQQAVTQFANNSRYRTPLNKVKSYITSAENSIISNAGKKGLNKTATNALQSAADILNALGITVDLGKSNTPMNPMLAAMNPALAQQNNPYGQPYSPYGQQPYSPYGQQPYSPYGQQNPYNPYGTNPANPYGTNPTNPYGTGDPRTQFTQLEADYNALRTQLVSTATAAQKNALNSIMNDVNNLRNLVNNQNYLNNPNNLNNLTNSMNNLQSKLTNYKNNYNATGTGTNPTTDPTTTTDIETLRTELETASTDMRGIEDAIRNFSSTQFPKVNTVNTTLTSTRNTLNQTQLDMLNTNPNVSSIRSRVNQVKSRVVTMKKDVYSVQQDVLNYTRNQLSTLKTLVNNAAEVVRNQYTGQVDTHNDDLRDIETDFNTSTYISDAANQLDWASRIRDLIQSIEATRVNVQTAINNNK